MLVIAHHRRDPRLAARHPLRGAPWPGSIPGLLQVSRFSCSTLEPRSFVIGFVISVLAAACAGGFGRAPIGVFPSHPGRRHASRPHRRDYSGTTASADGTSCKSPARPAGPHGPAADSAASPAAWSGASIGIGTGMALSVGMIGCAGRLQPQSIELTFTAPGSLRCPGDLHPRDVRQASIYELSDACPGSRRSNLSATCSVLLRHGLQQLIAARSTASSRRAAPVARHGLRSNAHFSLPGGR